MNNYLRHRNKKNTTYTPVFFVVLILILSAILFHSFSPSLFPRLTHSLARPLWSMGQATVSSGVQWAQLFAFKGALIEENKKLKEELKGMHLELFTRNLFFEENQRLKEIVNRDEIEETILATVLVRPSVSLYDTFVIDAGEEQGITLGSSVLVSKDIIIGRVHKVLKNTSLITLFSTPGEETRVVIGPEGITAIAKGRGSGNFSARLPRDVGVLEGDVVVMPGINPKLFAIVEKIIIDPTEPFKIILFKNPVNAAEITWTLILPSKQIDIIYEREGTPEAIIEE